MGSVSRGVRIMLFVMFGIAAGAACAFLRYPIIPLLPVSAILAVGAVLTGIALRSHPGVIAIEGFASIAAPQFAFLAFGLAYHLTLSTRLIPHVQTAIGQQLRAELEVPRNLPPDLAALVTQLNHA
jgi:hypothetical protein